MDLEDSVELALSVDATDHQRSVAPGAPTLVVYGDYECPYTRLAYRHVQALERRQDASFGFVYRHFPLVEIHPHALAAAHAAEAAAAQGRFWEMHDLLFHRQKALAAEDLREYAAQVGLDAMRFAAEVEGSTHLARIERDVASGATSGVRGTPTLFIDGHRHRGSYEAHELGPALGMAVERVNDGRTP